MFEYILYFGFYPIFIVLLPIFLVIGFFKVVEKWFPNSSKY